ncbi:unnamed protein product [Paramecium octaurelia]|uniref:Uncharacterized protein n=1 Tax=Paramecium octaurelia TaxID=43137 RepID=A0A8S1SFD4_PAROT|nr:unnamed protein product [Paramecium octaurelia]
MGGTKLGGYNWEANPYGNDQTYFGNFIIELVKFLEHPYCNFCFSVSWSSSRTNDILDMINFSSSICWVSSLDISTRMILIK